MPVIKSAKKKLRQDKKREENNNKLRLLFKKVIKTARKTPNKLNISKATRVVDKLAKKNLIHKNKAARLKSGLSKLIKTTFKTPIKTAAVKTSKPAKKSKAK